FAATCATGFTPGMPPPTFPKNAFASTSSGGGGGGKMTVDQLADYLKGKGINADIAENLALWADDQGLNLEHVQALIDAGAKPGDVLTWLQNGKITEANLNDVTTLVNQGVNDDALTQWLDRGVDLNTASTDITTLLNSSHGVSSGDIN